MAQENLSRKFNELEQSEKQYHLQVFGRYPVAIEHGKGCYVWDFAGKKYIDMIGAIATCSVGHGNKEVVKAITEQAKKVITTTNLYYTEPQLLLAKKLAEISGLQKSFFTNSGSEANETAIKIAIKYTKKHEFICAINCFHGRTLGALSATWKPKFKKPFEPLLEKFIFVEYNNADAVENAITENTAAVMIEPIQGEGGVIVPDAGYLKKLREICDRRNILMIVDEVQSGTGKTGKFFAYQHSGILPDIVTVAKGIANGVPLGATIVSEKVAACMEKGDHGCTFGGNPLACSSALATIKYIEDNNLMHNASEVGKYLLKVLAAIKHRYIKEVRGLGLMLSIEVTDKCKEIVLKLHEFGLLCAQTSDVNIRFLPALILTKKDADKAVKIIKKVLKEFK
ncbi:TPA: aspartate aminotransferase family protein [Candidatus Woesearchaeota archaeon]|nr:aspartate aminotransferase family protein [Candidatus Woesearchaeota archaeon]